MIDPAEVLRGTTVPCSFPGCGHAESAAKAKVPGFQVIRAMINRAVTLEDLVVNAICVRHAKMAGDQVQLFWFIASVRMLAQRIAERQVANGFFGRFQAPKQTRGNGQASAGPFNPALRRGEKRFDA